MELEVLDTLPSPAWPAPVQQHPIYAAALARLGVDHRALAWHDGLTGGAILVQRRTFGPLRVELASRAYLTAPVARALIRDLGKGLRGLALTPEAPVAVAGAVPVTTPAHVAEWDLTSRTAHREKAMTGAWRTALKKAARSRVNVHKSVPDRAALHDLFARDRAQQKSKGFRALPPHLVLAIHDIAPDALQLYRARFKGQTLAEALIICHQPTATYHIGWSSQDGREAQAMNLILWQATQNLADAGFERFDLGLVATDRSPGLSRFKLGTGAQVRALGATQFYGPLTRAISRFASQPSPPAQTGAPGLR